MAAIILRNLTPKDHFGIDIRNELCRRDTKKGVNPRITAPRCIQLVNDTSPFFAGVPTGAMHPKYQCVATLAGHHTRPIYAVSWNRTTGLIATTGGDDVINIFAEVCISCAASTFAQYTWQSVTLFVLHFILRFFRQLGFSCRSLLLYI